MKKVHKYYNIRPTLLIMCIFISMSLIGCEKNTEETFEGYGNCISNLYLGVRACEGENDIIFQGDSGHIYSFNKKTEKVSILCKDPACSHGDNDKSCIARKTVSYLQYFNGYYYYQDLFNDGFFKTDENTVTEIKHTNDSNISGATFIYNGNMYYCDKSAIYDEEYIRKDIVYESIKESKEKVVSVGEHIKQYFPQNEGIFVLTEEGILYLIDNQNRKNKVTEIKIDWMIPDDDYIYYLSLEKEGTKLCRMKKDGTEEENISEGKEIIGPYINNEYVYFSVTNGENAGLYMTNKDNIMVEKICDKPIIIASFEDYDKIIGKYYDEPDMPDGEDMVIMNKNGSDMKKLEIPVPESAK